MLNFTVGPVQMSDEICSIGAEQVPYFRTEEFSNVMFENETLIKKFFDAQEDARTVFLTGSGTAAMEAAVMNCLSESDKAIVVNGGSFGQRFVELCQVHRIPYEEVKLMPGELLTKERLRECNCDGTTAFLVNMHETSTGVLYDMNMIHEFCEEKKLFLIVDIVSAFLADEFSMKKYGVGVAITGSQKALAVPPGVSIVTLSPQALKRVEEKEVRCMYLNLKIALKDGERGQTPFTPAVGVLRQLNVRLKQIDRIGLDKERERISILAEDFRKKIVELPFEIASCNMSNAMTPVAPKRVSAYDVFLTLKDEYQIWVCPNGGVLRDKIFRVGHFGNLCLEDNAKLLEALSDMERRRLL